MKTEPLHSRTAITVAALATDDDSWQRALRRADGDRDDALPNGTRLHEFEVLGVLGAGGFGIVYLALDHTLRRTVAVKEYLPVDFARRTDRWVVVPRTASNAPSFAAGMQSFMKEAQLLAGFDHASLVKVHRFWKANGTAYMVMPHYPGRTLKEMQRTTRAPLDEPSLRRLLHPLLCALEVLHEAKVYHRDISPDNIMVLPDGKPVLLDFGSARRVVSDRTQALTAMFKPSFAAIEQYGDVPGLKQGAWTDLYALAGVMHFMLTGSPPVPAALRAVNDAQPRLVDSLAGRAGLSMPLLQALDWALAVRPDERPASVQAFRDVLDGVVAAPARAAGRVASPLPVAPATPPAAPASERAAAFVPKAAPAPVRAWLRRLPQRPVLRRALVLVAVSVAAAAAIWSQHEPVSANPNGNMRIAGPAETATSRPIERAGGMVDPAAPAPALALPARAQAALADPADAVERPLVAARTAAAPRKEARSAAAVARTSAPGSSGAPATAKAGGREPAPREACGDRNFISMAACMDRQCQAPAFRAHAQCESFRRYAESRRESELSR